MGGLQFYNKYRTIKNPWPTQFSGPCGTEPTHQAALLREMREQHGVHHLKNGWCEFFTPSITNGLIPLAG